MKSYIFTNMIFPPVSIVVSVKRGDYVCAIKDGMQQIYANMDEADLIIFGTPNYWYGPTAKMKLLIDRMRPYVANKKLKGKKAIVIIPAAEEPNACGPMIEMLRMSFDYLEMELVGQILAEAYERGEIKNNPEALKSAYDLGLLSNPFIEVSNLAGYRDGKAQQAIQADGQKPPPLNLSLGSIKLIH